MSGRGALHAGRRRIGRDAGQYAREYAGVSSGTQVRILRTGNPRIPEEGSSALGKSGPKAKPMDNRQRILYCIEEQRTDGEGQSNPADGRAGASGAEGVREKLTRDSDRDADGKRELKYRRR